MSSDKTRQPFRHPDHPRPVTRRDFLAQGFLAGSGMVMAPSLFNLLTRPSVARAQAAGACGTGAVSNRKIPFICIDLAGGANIAGSNVLVGQQGGQLDLLSEDGYNKLGLPPTMTPDLPLQVNSELGLLFHADSAFLRGILSKTSITTRANVNGAVICARSDNDTSNNPHNPMYGIARAGADGDLVTLIGSRSSESGGRSVAPMSMIDPTIRPTKVDRGSDAVGLVDTGKLVQLLSQGDAASVMRAVEDISRLKLDRINENQALEDLVDCGYVQSTDLVATFGDPTLLDPVNDPLIVDPAGLDPLRFSVQDLDDESKFEKTAAIMKLTMNGFAGAGTIEMGGYDYHDSTRASGEVRDFEAGQCMGAILEYAANTQSQVMLYVFSDGSVASNGQLDNSVDGRGKGIWRGDNSSASSGFFLVYDPVARPQLVSPQMQQLGYMRASGSVETSPLDESGGDPRFVGPTKIADDVNLLAESIVLNYMALHGEQGSYAALFPDQGLGTSASELDTLICFQPIA